MLFVTVRAPLRATSPSSDAVRSWTSASAPRNASRTARYERLTLAAHVWSDIEREPPAFLGRRVREVEPSRVDELPRLRLERKREQADERAAADDVDDAGHHREAVRGDAVPPGGNRGTEQTRRVVDALRDLDRLGGMRSAWRMIAREAGCVRPDGRGEVAVALGRRRKRRRVLPERDRGLVQARVPGHRRGVVQDLKGHRWVVAYLGRFLQRPNRRPE